MVVTLLPAPSHSTRTRPNPSVNTARSMLALKNMACGITVATPARPSVELATPAAPTSVDTLQPVKPRDTVGVGDGEGDCVDAVD